jgi:hypothetical protein
VTTTDDLTRVAQLKGKIASSLPTADYNVASTLFEEAIELLGPFSGDARRRRIRIDLLLRQLGSAYFANVDRSNELTADLRELVDEHGTVKQQQELADQEVAAMFRRRRFRPTAAEAEWARQTRAITPERRAHAEPDEFFRCGFAEFIAGDHGGAVRWFDEAAERAVLIGARRSEASALTYGAWMLRIAEDERALGRAVRARSLADRCGLPQYVALCTAVEAWDSLLRGKPRDALIRAESAIDTWRAHTPAYPFQWAAHTVAAAAAFQLGEIEVAVDRLRSLRDAHLQALPRPVDRALTDLGAQPQTAMDAAVARTIDLLRSVDML